MKLNRSFNTQQSKQYISYCYKLFCILLIIFSALSSASPLQDQTQLRRYYQEHFPNLTLKDYSNGIYAIDPVARQSWQAIEEFPPYENAIEQGERLFAAALPDGKQYADCFDNKGMGIANTYPRWDTAKQIVVTLAAAINECRAHHHADELAYNQADMLNVLAYMAYTSRGKPINVVVPEKDENALQAYEQGKAFYYQRQGQLNFACATCHIQNVGKKLRAEILSPSLGHTNNWPTYRLKWGEMGSLHRRFAECLANIQAKAYPEQSVEFRNLEYFLSYTSNGVPISGPSVRK
ncbi:MAG: sulfur oxidation c-type cytochrome SoxA [Gammaproteobacteria bacterium]|nr:sulfur oxidation c-type cytochrome SoxA [Gammaproteobacteria bacterium]